MLELENHITLNKVTIRSPNLCDRFTDQDLLKIGNLVLETYEQDTQSRERWYERNEAGMKLALQVQEEKNFPWPNCSNVKFPLVTIAALQFHARAYPALINGSDVVQCRVVSEDPDGSQTARAKRISTHMSWQVLEEDEDWETEEDRGLLALSIVGTIYKKSYYSESVGHNVSDLVLPKDLVINYWAKSVDTAPAVTHVIPMSRNSLHERIMRGTFRDVTEESWYKAPPSPDNTKERNDTDKRSGLTPPPESDLTPFTILEQQRWLDLDNDGYEEPYFISVEKSSGCVLRIVSRCTRVEDIEKNSKGEIIKINPIQTYSEKIFIPSPDGSLMGIGFGLFLGPLNESVDTAINQLFDAGTMSVAAGGFLGRGAKIRGGVAKFDPFGWNRVDASGDDLRKNIVELPVREPSNVLFNLLSLLINYTNRISGATDMMTGENPGQNTPAENGRAMIEQGQKIYSAIFKRVWRGTKKEFKILFELNAIYLPPKVVFGAQGDQIGREDYTGNPGTVAPAADPYISSDAVSMSQAMAVRQASQGNPGYDPDEVEMFFLKSMNIHNWRKLYPGQANRPPAAPDIKIQIQQMKTQEAMAQLKANQMQFVLTLQEQRRTNTAKIIEMLAKAEKFKSDANLAEGNQRINAFNAAIGAFKAQNDHLSAQIDQILESISNEQSGSEGGSGSGGSEAQAGSGGVPALEGPPNDSEATGMGAPGEGVAQGGVGAGA